MRNSPDILRRFLSVRNLKLVLFPLYYPNLASIWTASFRESHLPLHESYTYSWTKWFVARAQSRTLPGVLRNLQRKLRNNNLYLYPAEGTDKAGHVAVPVRFSVPGLLESPPGGPVLHRARPRANAAFDENPRVGAFSQSLPAGYLAPQLGLAYHASGEWTACILRMLIQGDAGGPTLLPEARGRYLVEAMTNLVDVLRGRTLIPINIKGAGPSTIRLSDGLYLDDRTLR